MQEEEQVRNRVMYDLLYVNPYHDLAPNIFSYYNFFYQMPPDQRYSWPIDTNARLVLWFSLFFYSDFFYMLNWIYNFYLMQYCSGGMNGFIWLCERNGWRIVIPSPVSGLPDITNNQVL